MRLANGLVMSSITYMIQLWGTSKKCWINEVQRLQNRAARYVLRSNRYEKVASLLEKCNWMSIHQLIRFHSITLLWKTLYIGHWTTLRNDLYPNYDGTLQNITGRIQMSEYSWKRRTITWWNELPMDLRLDDTFPSFKGSLRAWIKQNIRLKM